MTIKPSTISKFAVIALAVGLLIQLNANGKMSWATVDQDIEKQTVPTRTPTLEPVTPTVPPPTETHTPAPPLATNTPAPPLATNTPVPPSSSMTPTAAAGLAMITVNVDTGVYSGPGYNFSVLGTLEKGDTAVAVGRNADSSWWQIVFRETVGWVAGTDVTPSAAVHHVPVVDFSSSAVGAVSPATLPLAGENSWLLGLGVLPLIIGALLLFVGVRIRWPKSKTR